MLYCYFVLWVKSLLWNMHKTICMCVVVSASGWRCHIPPRTEMQKITQWIWCAQKNPDTLGFGFNTYNLLWKCIGCLGLFLLIVDPLNLLLVQQFCCPQC